MPPLKIEREWVEQLKADLPELPDQAQQRLMEQYGLPPYDAAILTLTPEFLEYFDQCLSLYNDAKQVSNWMMGELSKYLNQYDIEIHDCKIKPVALTRLLTLIDEGTISGKMAKDVFAEMFATGKEPDVVVKEKGMVQISDESTLLKMIDGIIEANPGVVEDYRKGKEKAFGFFVGQVMKATKGQANPAVVNSLLKERLKSE